jgi:DNA-binding response OmpR family regulator
VANLRSIARARTEILAPLRPDEEHIRSAVCTPSSRSPQPIDAAVPELDASQRAPTVVVIGGDEEVRELVVGSLKRYGFCARVVADSMTWLAQADAGAADAVLIDPLSWEVGLGLSRQILERSKAPVLLLTSSCMDDEVSYALAAGASDVICKPFSPRDLVMRVSAVVKQHHSASSRQPSWQWSAAQGTGRRAD